MGKGGREDTELYRPQKHKGVLWDLTECHPNLHRTKCECASSITHVQGTDYEPLPPPLPGGLFPTWLWQRMKGITSIVDWKGATGITISSPEQQQQRQVFPTYRKHSFSSDTWPLDVSSDWHWHLVLAPVCYPPVFQFYSNCTLCSCPFSTFLFYFSPHFMNSSCYSNNLFHFSGIN